MLEVAVNVLASTWHCSLWVKLLPLQSRIFSKSHDIAELERGIFWLSPAVHSVKVLPLFQFQSEAWLDENNDMKIQRCRQSHLKTRGGIKEGHFEGIFMFDNKAICFLARYQRNVQGDLRALGGGLCQYPWQHLVSLRLLSHTEYITLLDPLQLSVKR